MLTGLQEDYGDKGLDALEKKSGQMSGHNIDSEKMRGTNEKIVSPHTNISSALEGDMCSQS